MLMKYKQLLMLMQKAGLSPEQMGERLGISGMTVRRWKDLPGNDDLPDLYNNAALRVVQSLVSEGKLLSDDTLIRSVLTQDWLPFETAAGNLGISMETLDKFKADPKAAIETLSSIGSNSAKRDLVDASIKKINTFKRIGEDWAYRITHLMIVIRAKHLSLTEKLVAYGAFVYLLNPFDFIPDAVPVFGLVDDMFLLSVALAFYLKRYPEFFAKNK